MLETFKATLSPMLVMFACMVVGYISKKKNLTPDTTATVLSKLENYFFVPALIINTFMHYCTIESISKDYKLVIYSFIAMLLSLVISIPLSAVFMRTGYARNVYKYALTFGNFSFMGNAIVPQIMGEEYLYKYMLYTLPLNILVYSWGILILMPVRKDKKGSLKSLINPIFVSIIIGGFLGLTGLANMIPKFAATTIGNLAACMGPLAMVLTGFVIGQYNILELVKNVRVYIATFLRLIALPLAFIFALKFIGADSVTLAMTMFAFGTPLGLNTVVFPAAYGGDTSTGASMAMISHSLCIITIPLMFAFLNNFVF